MKKRGIVIYKKDKYSFFGRRKYVIGVRYDEAFNRITGETHHEYIVDSSIYDNIIIGANVRGLFEQAPEGLRPLRFVV